MSTNPVNTSIVAPKLPNNGIPEPFVETNAASTPDAQLHVSRDNPLNAKATADKYDAAWAYKPVLDRQGRELTKAEAVRKTDDPKEFVTWALTADTYVTATRWYMGHNIEALESTPHSERGEFLRDFVSNHWRSSIRGGAISTCVTMAVHALVQDYLGSSSPSAKAEAAAKRLEQLMDYSPVDLVRTKSEIAEGRELLSKLSARDYFSVVKNAKIFRNDWLFTMEYADLTGAKAIELGEALGMEPAGTKLVQGHMELAWMDHHAQNHGWDAIRVRLFGK